MEQRPAIRRCPISVICFFLLMFYIHLAQTDSFSSPLAARFSTHTAYRNVYRQPSLGIPTMCKPVGVDMLLRHGTSNPKMSFIESILPLVMKLKRSSEGAAWSFLKTWKNPFKYETASKLVVEGQREHNQIGARTQMLLKGLKLSVRNTLFSTINDSRARESAKIFARNFEGWTRRDLLLKDAPYPRYQVVCNSGTPSTTVVNITTTEYEKFKNGQELKYRLYQFTQRHSLKEFSFDDFWLAYSICMDDTAVQADGSASHWCSAFEKEDVYALEYLMDLEEYWKRSYGLTPNILGCQLAKDVLKTVEASKMTQIKGRFRFADKERLLSLITVLQLFRPNQELRADNYNKQSSRKFQTSKISPFAGNIALILLDCEKAANLAGGLYVMPVVNENSVQWTICNGKTMCPLAKVKALLDSCPKRRTSNVCAMQTSSLDLSRSTSLKCEVKLLILSLLFVIIIGRG